jgi:hypothetical protein
MPAAAAGARPTAPAAPPLQPWSSSRTLSSSEGTRPFKQMTCQRRDRRKVGARDHGRRAVRSAAPLHHVAAEAPAAPPTQARTQRVRGHPPPLTPAAALPAAGLYQLRTRWFRSTIPAAGRGNMCAAHPEREATVQCTVCVRSKVPQHLSYHCSPDCFKGSWGRHIELHAQALQHGGCTPRCPPPAGGGRPQVLVRCACTPGRLVRPPGCPLHAGAENGYDHSKPAGTLSTNHETWVEVGAWQLPLRAAPAARPGGLASRSLSEAAAAAAVAAAAAAAASGVRVPAHPATPWPSHPRPRPRRSWAWSAATRPPWTMWDSS